MVIGGGLGPVIGRHKYAARGETRESNHSSWRSDGQRNAYIVTA
jgi:hypothetical protein